MFADPFRRYQATLGFLVLMSSVYLSQLVIAGSYGFEVGFKAITSLPEIVLAWTSPWLHSTHDHIFQNAVMFALFGFWVEKQIGSEQFTMAVLFTGYTTNYLPNLLGFGGVGIGASGITNALIAFFTAAQFSRYAKATGENRLDMKKVGVHLLLFFIGTILVLRSIAEFIGYVAPRPGVATGAHVLGVVIGFAWFIYWRSQSTSRPRVFQQIVE